MNGETTRLPTSACVSCGEPLDAATSTVDDNKMGPGDISICLYCGHISALGDDYKLRPLTDAEMLEVAGHPVIIRAQKLREMFMAQRKQKQ